VVFLALGVASVAGCQEEITTSFDEGIIPLDAVTVEVTLPFEEFGEGLQGWGGYGRAYELREDIVARDFEGTLDARVLSSLLPYPDSITVRDSTGVFGPDTVLTFVGGKVVAQFDTLTSVLADSATLALGALSRSWDFRSVTWNLAVDSVGEQTAWLEPGAGPVTPLAVSVWNPVEGDSVVFEIDSAGVNLMVDEEDAEKGIRLEALTGGTRLDLTRMYYLLSTRPSTHQDTIVELPVGSIARTFIYDPVPSLSENEIRIGGVPAWRTVFTFELPTSLDGPPSLCAQVECPLELTASSLMSASLVLWTRELPAAFQPRDTLFLDVRPVLEPSRLPKSPLGSSLAGGQGIVLPPDAFGSEAGTEVEIPLGPFIQNLVEADPDLPDLSTVALLSSFEPLSLYFAAFEGPDSAHPPELRLILTLAEDVTIR
jgi:hypothetical protein